MNQLWLILIFIIVAVTCGFLISLIIDLKKTLSNINEFLKRTEGSLNSSLDELQQTLKSIRKVSDDVNDITSDIKTLSKSISEVGTNIKHVSGLVSNISNLALIKASGIKTGIKTGLSVLLKNIFTKKGERT